VVVPQRGQVVGGAVGDAPPATVLQQGDGRRIAARRPVGSIDLFSDSTDLVSHASWRATLRKLYE